MKKLLFFLSLLLFCGVFVYADVPKKLNLQGKLTSDSGQVLAEKSFSAVLHLRASGASGENYPVDTKAGITDSNGLYTLNFDVINFNFSAGSEFKVVITVDSQVISTSWSEIATNPYSFYSSTATYSILSANAITASSMTVTGAGSNLFWGYDSGGTNQLWRSVIVSTVNVTGLPSATVANATNAINSTNATTAITAVRASSMTVAGGSANNLFWGYDSGGTVQDWRIVLVSTPNVTGLSGATVANATNATNSTNATIATTATTAVRATSMTVTGAGVNLFWGYDSGGTVQNWRAVSSSTVTGLVSASVGSAQTITSNGAANQVWGYDGSGVSQGWRNVLVTAVGNGLTVTGGTASVSAGTGLNFSGTTLVVTTAPYATGAGTASTVVDGAITSAKIGPAAVVATRIADGAILEAKIANGAIISEHFKNEGDYGYTYDIKVATAAYAETSGADLAEIYASTELLTPGDVVSVDISKDNSIVKTKVAEDTLVAGVISTKPGLLMNKTEKGYELALVGKVPTKVCNEGGSIKRGDLLVSASIEGYAKKASDNPKTGTVIGKALENFDSVNGTILVLVNLQ